MTIKTLITAPAYFDETAITLFQQLGEVKIQELSNTELLQQIADYEVIAIRVDTTVNKTLIDAATKLKVIASGTTGLNHIDIEYAKKKGIEVIFLQGANTIATAEHTFALLLSLVRKIPAANASLLSGKWQRGNFIGTELHGKTLGVIGFGRIGKDMAKFAQSFGMNVTAYDPYLPAGVFAEHKVMHCTSLDILLAEADVITLHLLLTPETKGLINQQKLALMKRSALLINCSRGEVIVEADLLKALEEKRIAGAALDVFVNEPLPATDPLIHYAQKNHNLILTPHLAGSSKEAVHEAGLFVAMKTQEFFAKEKRLILP